MVCIHNTLYSINLLMANCYIQYAYYNIPNYYYIFTSKLLHVLIVETHIGFWKYQNIVHPFDNAGGIEKATYISMHGVKISSLEDAFRGVTRGG